MYMCLGLASSIRPSGRWLDVVSSNGFRSSLSFRFVDRVLWLLDLRLRWQWSCWWRSVSSPCPQLHCAVAVSPHFLRFDLTGECPGVRLSIQARTAQSHMEQSSTPNFGCVTLALLRILRHEFFVILFAMKSFGRAPWCVSSLLGTKCVILIYMRHQPS